MQVLRVKRGDLIVKRREKVKEWYIIQEGTAKLKYQFVEGKIGPNTIIGALEQDWYMCDYIAETDVTLLVFHCNSVTDLKNFLQKEPKMRRVFLRTAILQKHQLFCIYADLIKKINQFQHFMEIAFNEYNLICAKNKMEVKSGFDFEHIKPLEMRHKAENWELSNSNSLVKGYLEEYLNLFEKDENLCVGAIMEASAQMHRVVLGIGEMTAYFQYNKELLFGEKKKDLFHVLLELQLRMKFLGYDATPVENRIDEMFKIANSLGIYEPEFLDVCKLEYTTCVSVEIDAEPKKREADDIMYILDFAGYTEEEKLPLYQLFSSYKNVFNADAKSDEAYQIRKQINKSFYDVYKKCFFVAMEQKEKLPTMMEIFFHFGFMDSAFMEEEKVNELYELSSHMDLCRSDHVFTVFEWLKAVYRGEKEPSKNEFDLDYNGHLMQLYKSGEIKKEEIEVQKRNRRAKTEFEIDNMFRSVNRLTYGSITGFCPILTGNDLFNSLSKMLVTADKIDNALDEIRKIDFSVFYRELTDKQASGQMTNERMMHEILPDVILMPNAGTRAMMWQETASVRNDTPARFMLPIFTAVDIGELMLEVTGRYRWEICRKIQGVHWNDLRDRSLTSEYCDYLQFYRKNRELSAETKEQIKGALVRAKNNFREVFVKDYQNWIKYESKGGFRLNKYVRNIVFAYCPFSRSICDELKSNPMFTDMIRKHQLEMRQSQKRLTALYDKYDQSGEKITPLMKENLDYYLL